MPKIFNEILNEWVCVPYKPKKIASLCPSVTDTLVELGLTGKIVGVSSWCTQYLKGAKKPVLASLDKADYKMLGKLKPDLILTVSGIHLKLTKEIHSKGYNVFPLQLPRNVFEIIGNMLIIGTITNRQEKARKLAAKLTLELEKLRSRAAKIEKRPKLYAEAWPEKFSITFGGLTFTDDFIHFAGGYNIFSEKPLDYFTADPKEVKASNPDIIVFVFEDLKDMKQTDIASLMEKRKWKEVKAFKTGKIITTLQRDLPITHSGPSFMKAVKLLHAKFEEFGCWQII